MLKSACICQNVSVTCIYKRLVITTLCRSVCGAALLTKCPVRARSTFAVSPQLSARLGPEPSAVGYDDYETTRKTFRLELPKFYNFASDVIDRWALAEQVRDDVINHSIIISETVRPNQLGFATPRGRHSKGPSKTCFI